MADTTSLPFHVVLGGYTAETEGNGTGLRSLLAQPGGNGWAEVALQPLTSPTYVIAHPSKPWLLSVGEAAPSELVTLGLDDGGALTVRSRVTTGGDDGCHLALDPDARYVVVAHYGSGTVESFALDEHGGLSGPVGRFASTAALGPDAERQDGPHAHQVVFDGDELLAVDLGTDRIFRLGLGPAGELHEVAPPVVLPPGSGPRHLLVLGDLLVVACELSVELWLARRTSDGWAHTQTVPTTARTEASEPILPSALRGVGDRVYVATRGVDTITVLDVDREAGTASTVAEFDCGGLHPRDLVVSGGRLWVANQRSDRVSVFDTAVLPPSAPAYVLDVPRPACIVLLGETAR